MTKSAMWNWRAMLSAILFLFRWFEVERKLLQTAKEIPPPPYFPDIRTRSIEEHLKSCFVHSLQVGFHGVMCVISCCGKQRQGIIVHAVELPNRCPMRLFLLERPLFDFRVQIPCSWAYHNSANRQSVFEICALRGQRVSR